MFLTQIIDSNEKEREGSGGGGEVELKKQCQGINCEKEKWLLNLYLDLYKKVKNSEKNTTL